MHFEIVVRLILKLQSCERVGRVGARFPAGVSRLCLETKIIRFQVQLIGDEARKRESLFLLS